MTKIEASKMKRPSGSIQNHSPTIFKPCCIRFHRFPILFLQGWVHTSRKLIKSLLLFPYFPYKGYPVCPTKTNEYGRYVILYIFRSVPYCRRSNRREWLGSGGRHGRTKMDMLRLRGKHWGDLRYRSIFYGNHQPCPHSGWTWQGHVGSKQWKHIKNI